MYGLIIPEKNIIGENLKNFMKSKAVELNGERPKEKRHITFINCSTQFQTPSCTRK